MASVLKNANMLRRLMSHPCATPNPVVALELAVQAAAPVLVEALQFGCRDILKMAAGIRSHQLAHPGLTPQQRTRGRNPGYAPTPQTKCGRQMTVNPGAQFGANRENGVRAYYANFGPIEQALKYYFFAGLASQFLVNWASLLYRHQGCAFPGDSSLTTAITIPVLFPGLDLVCNFAPASCTGAFAGGLEIAILPGYYADITPVVTVEPLPGFGTSVNYESSIRPLAGTILDTSSATYDLGGATQSGINMYTHDPNRSPGLQRYQVHIINNGPGIGVLTFGQLHISTALVRPDVFPVSGCNPAAFL